MRQTSWRDVAAGGLLLSLVVAVACGASNTVDPGEGRSDAGEGAALEDGGVFRRAELLEAFGRCAWTQASAFVPEAAALEQALQSARTSPSSESIEAAREAWRAAMGVWQVNDLMQFGPGGPKSRHGGRDHRESIYSWPLFGRCAVEERVVSGAYEASDLTSAQVNERGLLAVEYLLFSEGSDNACAASAPINAEGTWAALSAEERTARKLAYAHEAAKLVSGRAQEIERAWNPEGDDFLREFTSAGQGSRTYRNDSLAFNVVADSLFYIEYELKDLKLAVPLGMRTCATDTCLDQVESQWARRGLAHLRQNLHGARLLFDGCGSDYSGLGYGDMLFALGHEQLSREMSAALVAAIAAVDAFETDDLIAAIQTDRAKVDALYEAIKAVTDRLKGEFVTVLDLEIPQRVEGDND